MSRGREKSVKLLFCSEFERFSWLNRTRTEPVLNSTRSALAITFLYDHSRFLQVTERERETEPSALPFPFNLSLSLSLTSSLCIPSSFLSSFSFSFFPFFLPAILTSSHPLPPPLFAVVLLPSILRCSILFSSPRSFGRGSKRNIGIVVTVIFISLHLVFIFFLFPTSFPLELFLLFFLLPHGPFDSLPIQCFHA